MTCFTEENADVLLAYFEGKLPEPDRRQIEAHAAECSACRGLIALRATLDEFAAPEVSLGFDAGLYARIETADRKRRWWTIAAPVAATAALAIGILFTYIPRQAVGDGTKQAAIDQDIQQLEQTLEDLELLKPINTI